VLSEHSHALEAEKPYELDTERILSIGRAPESDICLELAYASSTHCTVQLSKSQLTRSAAARACRAAATSQLCHGCA
jgi:hypothetical protein